MSQLDEQASFTIRMQGCVDQALTDWFGPVTIATDQCACGHTVTTLTATLADQAALVGLIRHLHALGIVLLSVERDLNAETTGATQ